MTLQKYSHYFQEIKFTRGQVAMREGDELQNLHLIFEGEFELSKSIAKANSKETTSGDVLKEFLPQTEHKMK